MKLLIFGLTFLGMSLAHAIDVSGGKSQVRSYIENRNSGGASVSATFTVPAGAIFRGVVSCRGQGSMATNTSGYAICSLTKSSAFLWTEGEGLVNASSATASGVYGMSSQVELQAGSYSVDCLQSQTTTTTCIAAVVGTNYAIP